LFKNRTRCINSHTFAPNVTTINSKKRSTWQKVVDPCEGYFLNTRPERGEKMRIKFPGKRTQTFKKRKPTLAFSTYTFKRNPSQKNTLTPGNSSQKDGSFENSRSYFRLTMCYCG